MPQTLLSLLALAAAAFFTLSQKEASTHTVESIVLDEFEVAVAGALLHTTEFADSRSFDDSTTPERLRIRLGLPQILTQTALDTLVLDDVIVPTSLFIDPTRMGLSPAGAEARCNVVDQLASSDCNDISDLNDRSSNTWRDVTLETANGDPLPVEVRVAVSYVEANNPDRVVRYRTNHKRVDVTARSPLLLRKYPNHAVQMHRVISFDPETALEYLKRTSCVVSDAVITSVVAAEARVTAAQAASEVAHAQITTTRAAAEAAVLAAEASQAQIGPANAAAAAAQAGIDLAWTDVEEAYSIYLYYVGEVANARNNGQRRKAERARDDAWEEVLSRYGVYVDVRENATAAVAAADQAQSAAAAAWAAATAAQETAAAAVTAAANADRTLAAAVASLQSLTRCAPTTRGGAPVYGGGGFHTSSSS